MIAFLRGKLHDVQSDFVVVDVGGVGYKAFVSQATLRALPARGNETELHIHTHLREDALVLFGFATVAEMQTFGRLIQVSGVGPRLALSVLSSLPPQTLAQVVAGRDLKALTRVSGIGRKTAERLLLELKDRLQLNGVEMVDSGDAAGPELYGGPLQDGVAALEALGYSTEMAQKAIQAAAKEFGEESEITTSGLVRAALRQMTA